MAITTTKTGIHSSESLCSQRFGQPFHESLCNEALGDVIGKLKSDSDALVDPKAGGDKAPSS